MLRPVNVSIPVGKGIDESVDPHHLRAPFGHRAENMRPEHAGSLRKRPGWSALGASGGPGANVIVADRDRALLLGTSPAQIVTAEGVTSLSHASPIPLTVTPHRLRAIAGFGHCAQVACAGGYTATIVSILGDVTTNQVGAGYVQWDYLCELTIWDADWRPVWGPYRVSELKWLPRVEPIAIDDQTMGFVFFALGTRTSPVTYPYSRGALAELSEVYMAQGFPGGPPPSGVLVDPFGSGVAAAEADGETRWKIYDTHSDGESHAYVTWLSGQPGDDYFFTIARANGLAGSPSDIYQWSVGDTIDRDHSLSIYRDAATDTILVHHSPTDSIHYIDSAYSTAGTLTVAPLDGVGSASAVDRFAGSDAQVPEFYRGLFGQLYLNELPITLTGAGPATPSAGSPITPSLAHLYKPIALDDRVLYSRASLAHDDRGWAKHAELYHLEAHPTYGGAPRPQVDLSLMESRFGTEAFGCYSMYTQTGDPPESTATVTWPCVVGQAARVGGKLRYPVLPLTDQQNPRAELSEAVFTGSFDPYITLSNRYTYQSVTAGAGYYNDEQYLAILEVDPSAPTYSADTHEGSLIVAAGHPSVWSGETVHPMVPRAPVVSGYGIPTSNADRRVDPAAVGIINGSAAAWGDIEGVIDYTRPFLLKAVLVFTDASGLEYRSAPSRARAVPLGINGSGDGGFPTYLPAATIAIEPSVLPFIGQGRSLDVELYVTERRDPDGGDPDETTYTMVCRMPLQRDAQGRFFVLDTMQDLAVQVGPGTPVSSLLPQWQDPPHVKPLYTLSGEQANLPPPTSHVTAQVAGYAFLLPAEALYEIWNSKPLVKGRSPEWSPALITYAPPACGGIVSLAGAYDRLYLLCRSGVWELPVLGGPDALGNGSFGSPHLVYRGQGCISHMGTIETPRGVFYVTRSGPRLIGGDGSVDIGRAVRTAIDWTAVVAATYDPEQDEVTWWTSGPNDYFAAGSVSYSLRHEAWSTSTLGTRAAAVWDGGVLRVGPDLILYEETRSTAEDGGRSILGKYTTPWLSFGDVQGFKRVWEVEALGRLHAGEYGRIRISVEYDYVETIVDTYEWTYAELAALTKGFQISAKPCRQQVDAIRITVEELEQDTGKVDQGGKPIWDADIDWTLTGINVRVAAKTGLMKLQAEAKK